MASITSDVPNVWEVDAAEHNVRLTIASGETIFAGQIVAYHTSNEQEIITPTDLLAANFAGIAMTGGVAGDVIEVRARGMLGPLVVAGTFAAGAEGAIAYGDNTASAQNNVADITDSATTNLPLGRIARVVAGGAGATVVIAIGAEGLRGDG